MTTPPLRILVVDDNADSARMLKVLLRCEGHEARIAFDGNRYSVPPRLVRKTITVRASRDELRRMPEELHFNLEVPGSRPGRALAGAIAAAVEPFDDLFDAKGAGRAVAVEIELVNKLDGLGFDGVDGQAEGGQAVGDEVNPAKELQTFPFAEDRLVLIAPRDHVVSQQRTILFRDACSKPC